MPERTVTSETIAAYAEGLRDMEQAVKRALELGRFIKATHPGHAEALLSGVADALTRHAEADAPEPDEKAISEADTLREGVHTAEVENERLRVLVEAKQASLSFWMTNPCAATGADLRIKTLAETIELLRRFSRQAVQVRREQEARGLDIAAGHLEKQLEAEARAVVDARVTEAEKALNDPVGADQYAQGMTDLTTSLDTYLKARIENLTPRRRDRRVREELEKALRLNGKWAQQTLDAAIEAAAKEYEDASLARGELTRVNQE